MTSIERTAYPRFKQPITARELHVFFTPVEEERARAEEVTDPGEHQLALLLALIGRACQQPAFTVSDVRRSQWTTT